MTKGIRRRSRVRRRRSAVSEIRYKFERMAVRASKYTARLKSYNIPVPNAVKVAEGSIECIRKVVAMLDTIPSDWRPARGTVGGAVIEEGAVVELNEKGLREYGSFYDKKQTFEVVKIFGNRLLCEGTSGRKSFSVPLLRTYVKIVEKK